MSAAKQAVPPRVAAKLGAVPAGLRARRQWVAWRFETRDNRTTKVPYLPLPSRGRRASANDPATWGTFEDAVAALSWADGIGYVFSQNDPYAGIDLDDVLDDAGLIRDAIIAVWVMQLDSYTEVTPSGRGLHILVKGKLLGRGRRREFVEFYDHARFFAMTGVHVVGTPAEIQSRQAQLDLFYGDVFGLAEQLSASEPVAGVGSATAVPAASRNGTLDLTDEALLRRARAAHNGAKFRGLYDEGLFGGYKSRSEADLALCDLLAFWTRGDPARIDRLFRSSALMRNKWDRADYRELTITRAISDAFAGSHTGGVAADPPRGIRALGLPIVSMRLLYAVRDQCQHGGSWRTTIPILMAECGASDSTLRRHVRELKAQGRITSEPVPGNGGGLVLGLTEKALQA